MASIQYPQGVKNATLMRENVDKKEISVVKREHCFVMAHTRVLPAGVKTVTDHVLFFSVFTDGFEAYSQFVKDPRSNSGVIGKLHNTNSYDAHSPIFARFVSVMAKKSGVNVMERVNVLLLGSLGREGTYHSKIDQFA